MGMVRFSGFKAFDFFMKLALARIAVAVTILFTLSSHASDSSGPIQIGVVPEKPMVEVNIDLVDPSSPEQMAQTVLAVAESKAKQPHTTVVVSTDQEQIIRGVLQSADKFQDNVILAPLAKDEAKQKTKFSTLVKNYAQKSLQSIQQDKIGFVIVTYTTAADTLVWLHSAHLSQFERTGNVAYTIALALTFGLNKDTWSKTTRPIQDFFRKILKPENNSRTNPKDLASRFLGNFSLSMLTAFGRVPFLAMDQIIDGSATMHILTMPALMSLVSTLALFTWSENLSEINQLENPTAKFVFRRVSEMRTFILGTFATTAALLSPHEYGYTPWMTLGAIGITGAIVYFNGESLTTWIDSRPTLQKIMQRFQGAPAGVRCVQLF